MGRVKGEFFENCMKNRFPYKRYRIREALSIEYWENAKIFCVIVTLNIDFMNTFSIEPIPTLAETAANVHHFLAVQSCYIFPTRRKWLGSSKNTNYHMSTFCQNMLFIHSVEGGLLMLKRKYLRLKNISIHVEYEWQEHFINLNGAKSVKSGEDSDVNISPSFGLAISFGNDGMMAIWINGMWISVPEIHQLKSKTKIIEKWKICCLVLID